VAAAAIVDGEGRVLLARRPDHVHQGGLWEFPGGKVEGGESVEGALARELEEELGLNPTAYRPLIRVHHSYPGRDVLLDVWRVHAWEGTPHGREGQPTEWVAVPDLRRRRFPPANLPIIAAVRLPDTYLITPDAGPDAGAFLQGLEGALAAGVRLVQLRLPSSGPDHYRRLAREVLGRCRDAGARLLLNADPRWVEPLRADGVHLNSARLRAHRHRPLDVDHWVAASCHDADEVGHACALGVDFIVVSPIRSTRSHPGSRPLGWQRFWTLAEQATVPVYALGGLARGDLRAAWAHGAQGIAAIRGLWAGP
jgi:8-oxo-dGTP diphosphatase